MFRSKGIVGVSAATDLGGLRTLPLTGEETIGVLGNLLGNVTIMRERVMTLRHRNERLQHGAVDAPWAAVHE